MFRRIICLLIISLCIIALSACSQISPAESDVPSPSVDIYYMLKNDFWDTGDLISCESRSISGDDTALSEALSLIFSQPTDDTLTYPYPTGTRLLSYSFENGLVALELSEQYGSLTGMDATIADSCIVLTLCSLDNVYSVSISVENGRSTQPLSPSSVIANNITTSPYEKVITLYFSDSEGRYLISEERTLTTGQDSLLVRFVIEELLNGPRNTALRSAIPEGTELLGISLDDGICTVNLSGNFVKNMPTSCNAERQAIYSIVNSLTSVVEVETVRFMIDGKVHPGLNYLPLDTDYSWLASINGQEDENSNEYNASLYMELNHRGLLTGIPARIRKDNYQTNAYQIVDALISIDAGVGLSSPIPSGTKLLSAVVLNGICRVNMTSEFAAASESDLMIAAQALTATLTSLDTIDDVQIYVEGAYYDFGVDSMLASLNPALFLN